MSYILIADDNEQNLYILRVLLTGNGYEVTTALNGREALDQVHHRVPDLIITDLLMPVMDGFGLCRTIKTDDRFRRIPIMVYTATYTEPEDEKLALSLGADRFVVKPTDPIQLMEIVNEILKNGSQKTLIETDEMQNGETVEREYRKRVAIKLEKKLKELEREIADRTRLEAELKEREQQYRCIFESVAEGLLILDLTGKIVELNPAACRMYGYSRNEALERSWYDFSDSASVTRLFEFFDDPEGAVFTESGEHSTKDSSCIAVEVRGVMFTYRGSPHFLAAIDDVSEQRCLEEQLMHSQKMEAVGRLAGGIAHDFNNLLQAILGNADLMMANMNDDSTFRDEVGEITAAAERATALSGQLLAFSRSQLLRRRDLDINSVITSILKILQRLIGEDIVIEKNLSEVIGTVHADQGQMEQVIMNLCVNARDAMPAGGTLSITTDTVSGDARHSLPFPDAEGKYVRLNISDTGCGMDSQTLERAFDPFFTTKGPHRGTGLGLATGYGIVRQHGGMIVAESEAGTGTKFSVYLPVVERPVSEPKPVQEGAPPQRGQETLIVAEDDQAVCKLASRILEQAGYTVYVARDGEQAWELFCQHKEEIDLVVLDLVMPKMSGAQVRKRILEERDDVRFLLTSGHSFGRYKLEDLDDIPLIMKPYRADAILEAVREALDLK